MQRQEVSSCRDMPISLKYTELIFEKLDDALYVSQELRRPEGAAFVKAITDAEAVLDCVAAIVCPELHSISLCAIDKLKSGEHLSKWDDIVKQWPCVFSGIEVISNRVTPLHRDPKAAPTMYDFLVSAGNHQEAWLDLPDVNAKLAYNPGTVVAVCGRVLRHGVEKWIGGERICFAHFIRDAVHQRLGLPRPDWVKSSQYVQLMDKEFINRQHW
jgi:hypothetical protein